MEFSALNTDSVPTSLLPLLSITIQRIHAVHRGCTEASQWIAYSLVLAELERRKGNHRIVAVGATSRDMGTE